MRVVRLPIAHATCVSAHGKGLLLQGRTGSGKSGLALQLMALGATLVADDRVLLRRDEATLTAICPEPLRGRIEARGIGILKHDFTPQARIHWIVDLDLDCVARLPQCETRLLEGVSLPLIRAKNVPNLAYSLMILVQDGRRE